MKLVALAKNPVPGGAVPGELKTPDGAVLRFVRWDATRGPRRGTVCLFGGRGEFAEKYFEVVADLRRRGFAVATVDWRGQGGSSRALANPKKGHIWSFNEYDNDLKLFMREIVLPDCPPPFMALGHSMGANILLRNASRPGSWFERMILVSPMISIADERVKYPQSAARAYAEIGTLIGFGRSYIKGGSDTVVEQGPFDGNILTSDRERWYRNKAVLDASPNLGLGSPTIAWLRAAYRSMALVASPGFAGEVRVPMMVFVAGKDRVVSSRSIEDFAVGLKVGTHVLLPSAQHEILQEADSIRLRFWAAFDAYMGLDEAAA
jgi:lysophospholipase